jgi:hypothetical protein
MFNVITYFCKYRKTVKIDSNLKKLSFRIAKFIIYAQVLSSHE